MTDRVHSNGRGRGRWLELVLFLLTILTGWAAWHAFRIVQEVDRIPLTLTPVQREFNEIAEQVEMFLAQSHTDLVAVATRRDAAAWQRFQLASRTFRKWLETKQATVTKGKLILVRPIGMTVDFVATLAELQQATDAYLRESQRLGGVMGAGLVVTEEIEEAAEGKADVLRQMATQARSQAGAIDLFLTGSRQWFGWLRQLMIALVLTLGGLVIWLVVIGYRRIVAPLRQRLSASEVVIENQQKLAHFGQLAAGVAHEIRNPLTAISARLFTLERALPRGSPELEDAGVIRAEINRLNRIVRDFLATARPAEPTRVVMTSRPLLEEVCSLLRPACERQNVTLELAEVVDAPLFGDAHQLKQVLINLVQNAAESCGTGGLIRLRGRLDRQRVLLEVEDNGPGIPPAVQRRLFEPFFSTKPGGAGLGLSIAAGIVERHGGKLDFQTEPGRGTTFRVSLPVHNP